MNRTVFLSFVNEGPGFMGQRQWSLQWKASPLCVHTQPYRPVTTIGRLLLKLTELVTAT
jgi:hypothetical protein